MQSSYCSVFSLLHYEETKAEMLVMCPKTHSEVMLVRLLSHIWFPGGWDILYLVVDVAICGQLVLSRNERCHFHPRASNCLP